MLCLVLFLLCDVPEPQMTLGQGLMLIARIGSPGCIQDFASDETLWHLSLALPPASLRMDSSHSPQGAAPPSWRCWPALYIMPKTPKPMTATCQAYCYHQSHQGSIFFVALVVFCCRCGGALVFLLSLLGCVFFCCRCGGAFLFLFAVLPGGAQRQESLTGCGDLDLGDLDLYRFWKQLSQMLTNFDEIKTKIDK